MEPSSEGLFFPVHIRSALFEDTSQERICAITVCLRGPITQQVKRGTFAALAFALLIAACAELPAPAPPVARALVEDGAVRSVFYPLPVATCREAPCAGPVPAEFVAGFKSDLKAVGFAVVETGAAAFVARIRVDHVATTPIECDMNGTVYVGDNRIAVKRSFTWKRTSSEKSGTRNPKPLSQEMQAHVLRICLAAFAASLKEALDRSPPPDVLRSIGR